VPALRVLRDSKLALTLTAIRDLVLQLQENDRLTGTLDEARGLFDRVAAFAVQRRTLAHPARSPGAHPQHRQQDRRSGAAASRPLTAS